MEHKKVSSFLLNRTRDMKAGLLLPSLPLAVVLRAKANPMEGETSEGEKPSP